MTTNPQEPERILPDEPFPIEVLHDQVWVPGLLLAWQRWPTGWRAYCSWSSHFGQGQLGWINGDRLRPRDQ
ncbi:protein of unknown function [Modestobacter italicus]|uniref:Uncharacterized protein n=1 Tax=Modestobacter italicus (strain DSM 44449 / CECT 9708 / BC 501) TaxID=2732864 RepID=I4F0L5_MODI5|nr:protein of unknown function [Modestobacter marinus]